MTIKEALEKIERDSTRTLEELYRQTERRHLHSVELENEFLLGWHRARVSTANEILSMIEEDEPDYSEYRDYEHGDLTYSGSKMPDCW
jgi:hypothetical protein